MFVPVCVRIQALMFWVVDNFLMKKVRTKAKLEEREAEDDPRGSNKVRYRRAMSHDDSESEVSYSSWVNLKMIIPMAGN